MIVTLMFLVLSLLFSWFDKHNQLKEHQNKIEKKHEKKKDKELLPVTWHPTRL